MTDPLLFDALRKLQEAADLLRLVLEPGPPREAADIDVAFLNTPLNEINFGPGYTCRLQNMFRTHRTYYDDAIGSAELVTVRDLVALTEAEILHEPNIGKQCVARLKAVLEPHGLRLGMDLKLRRVA